ncbi:MAG: AI-2E family transporter [Bacteroidales bacterium]|nr:AI-2E family transporter [Bacteroidales bacterium]
MTTEEKYWRRSLLTVILFLGIIVFFRILPFLSGILGACTIYILVRRQMFYLTEKKRLNKKLGALLITLEVILVFLIPLSALIWLGVAQIQSLNFETKFIIEPIQEFVRFIKLKTGFDILSADSLSLFASVFSKMGERIMAGVSGFAVNIVMLVFFLFFLLLGGRAMEQYIRDLLPFSEKNKNTLISKTHLIIQSNALGIPLLALIQGFIAFIGYNLFGLSNPLILALLTAFASIIPIVGTALVWVPCVAYLALHTDWFNTIGLTLYGAIVISQSDNLIRFILQKKMANIHPLITVFGVIVGLQLFSFIGVILGPAMLSFLILCIDIFKKDYLKSKKIKEEVKVPIDSISKE